MIELRERRIVVDGVPRLLIGGEVHYFRLAREEWQDRLDKLKAAGGTMVGSYIPWLCHEPEPDHFDLDGHTRTALDLGAFIDLCRDNDLLFFARPGPFVMAELKNEGIPFYVYERHPEIQPVGWDGRPDPTRGVDYLSPGFLAEVRRWYAAVMPILVPRLHPNGGNVVAVQLDNEVGMLAWVANAPDLSDHALAGFREWRQTRTGVAPELDGLDELGSAAIRSPDEKTSLALHREIGHYARHRFARYIATLREYAEAEGVRGVPFVVNIHGTADGRGLPFPIGISQLAQSYTQVPGYVAGSDFYLGELSAQNFSDLYLINAFMAAVNTPDQPLTAVEFEAGSGDYANDQSTRYDPAASDFKVRMCLAQGNRLLNFYLFTGGINYRLDAPVGDGNDRISFTGERHGTGAPVGPEGQLNYTYERLARTVQTANAVADKLADMDEERDNVTLGFIPDYYLTESVYPGSAKMRELVDNLEWHRGGGARQILARTLLYAGFRFGAVDIQMNIQNRSLNPERTLVLALASARFMAGEIQQTLVDYLTAGGRLLLCGEVPTHDMVGTPCTLLADALGLTVTGNRWGDARFYLSVVAEGWAAPRPEERVSFAQFLDTTRGEVILRQYQLTAGTGKACGVDVAVGAGRAIVITCDYPGQVDFYAAALAQLGAEPALRHDGPAAGIFLTATANRTGERFLHMLNLDGFAKSLHLTDGGRPLFDGQPVTLAGREALMLPLNLTLSGFEDVCIAYATAEITALDREAGTIEFRLAGGEATIAIATSREVETNWPCELRHDGATTIITARRPALAADRLTVRLS